MITVRLQYALVRESAERFYMMRSLFATRDMARTHAYYNGQIPDTEVLLWRSYLDHPTN